MTKPGEKQVRRPRSTVRDQEDVLRVMDVLKVATATHIMQLVRPHLSDSKAIRNALLVLQADSWCELRPAAAPRPYWPQSHGGGLAPDARTAREARRDFTQLIGGFADNGYLAEVFGEYCIDDHDDLPHASEVIEGPLGVSRLWPLAPEAWDEDAFYGLVAVFHDLVSRPRKRWLHTFSGCGWHHQEFHNGPARVLYRWKVNRVLHTAGLAIFNLGRILEDRRGLLKQALLKKDEGALFLIANSFDRRHRKAGQQAEYDEAFLDWIFWWYLATVELTNRLITFCVPDAGS
ncbi:hypothetical protein [Actinacidiphila glaucinigra]|uniref:hypothetical protein n=1 Tax=Actinacidiphila glaucinigra TaxID=235986 RepID=UPI00366E37F3